MVGDTTATGECTHVPYAKNLPPRVAKGEQVIACWPVREVNQTILVWYHPDKIAPTYEPIEIPEAQPDHPDWSALDIYRWDIEVHMQEMAENAVDPCALSLCSRYLMMSRMPRLPSSTASPDVACSRRGIRHRKV
jgi:hypothetical protein